ncbi:MAG TPA: glucoamylase family protein [Terriglobales bacterium]
MRVNENSQGSTGRSRRDLLKQMAALLMGTPLAARGSALASAIQTASGSAAAYTPASAADYPAVNLSPDDIQLLDDITRAGTCYFWEQANPDTGLVKDRCNAREATTDSTIVASIAATGFGLTALSIGESRNYISYSEAANRVVATLRFLWKKLANHRGFFYHWADVHTGERIWDSEISSVDTAILLCGVLTARAHFRNREITDLATAIFNRVDWSWLSEDTALLPHGWMPEVGFLPYRWDDYSELMMMYLLGLGSSVHPLREETWNAWKRTIFDYEGLRYIGSFAPLFVHQYSQAWFDFRAKRDHYADYFKNSVIATEAHRRFCLELAQRFPDYSEDLWGITASDSEEGYVVWGGPPEIGPIDGTVVPCASAGSLPFAPQAALRVLHNMKNRYPFTWSTYGFVDAFNPLKNWYDTDVIGIDVGISVLMAENLRSGFVWRTFMKNPEAQRGMKRAGFTSY